MVTRKYPGRDVWNIMLHFCQYLSSTWVHSYPVSYPIGYLGSTAALVSVCYWVQCSLCVNCVKIDGDTEYLRRCTGKLLKDAIVNFESGDSDSKLVMQLRYYVRLPDPNTHVNHVLQEVVCSLFVLILCHLPVCMAPLHCCKGDQPFQWEMPKFDPPPIPQPLNL